MITSTGKIDRRVVPVWRSLSVSLVAPELGSYRYAPSDGDFKPAPELEVRLAAWGRSRQIIEAGELLETAIIDGDDDAAQAVLGFLLDDRTTAATALKRLALSVAERVQGGALLPEMNDRVAKHVWRARTRAFPANAMAWVELALCETITGKPEAALRAMTTALSLAPNNRHVLRSASRLFLHQDRADRAHDVFVRSPASKVDPWLMAAEVATASVAKTSPKLVREGRRALSSDDFSKANITELASALGTLELTDGSRKKARDLFRESVVDPTANAAAQAEWASTKFSASFFDEAKLQQVADAHEAHAIHVYGQGMYAQTVQSCRLWARSERYSVRPFELGTVAAAEMDDFATAATLAEDGLRIRKAAPILLNGLAFALINLGNLERAEGLLREVTDADEVNFLVAKANFGMIALRRQQTEKGLTLYRDTIEGFQKLKRPQSAASARTYLARTAEQLGLPFSGQLIDAAKAALEDSASPSLKRIIEDAEKSHALRRVAADPGASFKLADLNEVQRELFSKAGLLPKF